MKIRICAALLIAVLALSLMAGCAAAAPESASKSPEQTVKTALSAATVPVTPETAAPAAEFITQDEAVALALSHAGFTDQEVSFFRVEPELYDRVPHYDVEFQEGYWEYEYEIHAQTGAVISFEKDDP